MASRQLEENAETKGDPWLDRLLIAAVIAPVLFGLWMLAGFAPDMPWQDDYRAILEFCLKIRAMPTLPEKLIGVVALQHNDYKLIFEHVIVLTEVRLLGHINFTILIALGNAFVLGILYLTWKMCRREGATARERLLVFLPACLMVSSLNYAETLNWAMTGLQNVPVVVFSMAALLLLAPEGDAEDSLGRTSRLGLLSNRRFWLACVAALLAACTSANGFLVAPIGVWLLLQRPRWMTAVWSLVFVPPLAAYLYRYHSNFPTMPVPIWTKPAYFLAVLGGAAPDRTVLLVLAGIGLLLVWGWSFRAGYQRQNPYAAGVSIWLVETAAVIAAGRGSLGLASASSSRYRMYADLMLVFCYLFAVRRLGGGAANPRSRRRLYVGSLALSLILFWHGELQAWHIFSERKAELRTGLANYRTNPTLNSPMYLTDPVQERDQAAEDEAARRILNESIASGLYVPPQ